MTVVNHALTAVIRRFFILNSKLKLFYLLLYICHCNYTPKNNICYRNRVIAKEFKMGVRRNPVRGGGNFFGKSK